MKSKCSIFTQGLCVKTQTCVANGNLWLSQSRKTTRSFSSLDVEMGDTGSDMKSAPLTTFSEEELMMKETGIKQYINILNIIFGHMQSPMAAKSKS